MSSRSDTGVDVKLGFFVLAFFFFACTPRVEIDGEVHKRPWGTHFFPLSPGKHNIRVYFGYLFMPECGANSINVSVIQGSVTRISYYMWPWVFAKGELRIAGHVNEP